MFLPVSPEEQALPNDVVDFTESLRDRVPAPKIALGAMPRLVRRLKDGAPMFLDDSESETEHEPAAQGEAPPLDHWTVQAHVYSTEVAAHVGILAGLFGGSGKVAKAGAMDEAKRFRLETTSEGRQVEVGIAVRLVAAITDWKVDADITLPNIAAAAQINVTHADARIGIDVVGYSGPLGALLPSPRQLDVTTLADYLVAFTKIQAQVFGDTGLPFLTPAVLAYSVDDPHDGPDH